MHYGIDLHTTTFMVAWRDGSGKIKRKQYPLTTDGLAAFKATLAPVDVLAIESTMTSYFFHDQVRPLVADVIIVNPFRFKVISESRSKTESTPCSRPRD